MVKGAAALIALTVIAVSLVQIGDGRAPAADGPSPATVYELSFQDLGADRLAVVDTRAGNTIAFVEPGKDGLVRGALRGLKRARELKGAAVDAPYQLVIWDSGRLTLSDLGIDEHIPIDSFGLTDTGVLAQFLQLQKLQQQQGS